MCHPQQLKSTSRRNISQSLSLDLCFKLHTILDLQVLRIFNGEMSRQLERHVLKKHAKYLLCQLVVNAPSNQSGHSWANIW